MGGLRHENRSIKGRKTSTDLKKNFTTFSKNFVEKSVIVVKAPRTFEASHACPRRQETLEDVGEVDQEHLEAHEVRETPLENEKLIKFAGIRRKFEINLPEEVESITYNNG